MSTKRELEAVKMARRTVLRELFRELKAEEANEHLNRNYTREQHFAFAAYQVHQKLEQESQ